MRRRPPVWIAVLLALSFLVPFPVVLHAAVAHVQTITANDGGSSSTTLATGSMTTSAGSLLLMAIACHLTASVCPAISTVRLDGSTDFTSAKDQVNGEGRVAIWYLANGASGSHTVTVTWASASTFEDIFFTEVTGAATSSPLDGACVSATGTSAAPASGNLVATATSFFYGAAESKSFALSAGGSGWTVPTNGIGGQALGAVEYKANPGTTTHNADFVSGSDTWAAAECAFLVAGAAGNKPPCLLLGLSC